MTLIEAAEESIGRASKAHMALLVLAAAIGLAFWLGQIRLPGQVTKAEAELVQIGNLHSASAELVGKLRSFLLASYSQAPTESLGMRGLLRDALLAKRGLKVLAHRLAITPDIPDEKRLAINKPISRLTALSQFNVPSRGVVVVKDEPVLTAAETILGTISWSPSIREARLQDLIRLSYLASIRPKNLKRLERLDEATDKKLPSGELPGILDDILIAHDAAMSEFSRQTRLRAANLWKQWLTLDGLSPAFRDTIAVTDTDKLEALQLAAVKQLEVLKAESSGKVPFALPGLNRRIDLYLALIAYPFVLAVGYLLIGLYLLSASMRIGAVNSSTAEFPGTLPVFLLSAKHTWKLHMLSGLASWGALLAPVIPVGAVLAGDPQWIEWTGIGFLFLALIFAIRTLAGLRRVLG